MWLINSSIAQADAYLLISGRTSEFTARALNAYLASGDATVRDEADMYAMAGLDAQTE